MGFFGAPNIEKLKAEKNVKKLIEALSHKDSDIRRRAAEALGEIKDAGALVPLIAALKDRNKYVREKAAEALTKFDFDKLYYETKTSIFEAFKAHFADPLQMQDYRLENMRYIKETSSVHPSYEFEVSARDMARFGLLFLYGGEWKGRQLIPASWVKESTQVHSDIGILGGYGYMWWAAREGEHFPFLKFPDGTFSARGTGEQVILVIPEWDIVIVHRTNVLKKQERYMHVTEFAKILKLILDARS